MLKIYISLGLALLIIGLFAVVQDKDVSTYRVWSLVEVVGARTVADTDSGSDRAWDLQIAGRHGDACAIAMRSEISRYPNNIDVQLFREIPSRRQLRWRMKRSLTRVWRFRPTSWMDNLHI